MSVSREDREAYEKGVEDSKKGFLSQLLSVEDVIRENVFYTSSERAAYEKGLGGERLDEDKGKPKESSLTDWFATGTTSETSEDSESNDSGSSDSGSSSGGYSSGSYSSGSGSSGSFLGVLFWVFFIICICMVVIGHVNRANINTSGSREEYTTPNVREYTPQPLEPPEYIVDYGACPFEGCVYGQRWKAGEDIQAYSHRPDRPDTPLSFLEKKSVIKKGEWVLTLNGLLIAKRHEGRVGESSSHGWEGGPVIHKGQVVPLYSTSGENCWKSWVDGRFFVICNPEYEVQEFIQEWWVKVLLPDRTEAWVSSENPFASQEYLNDLLGQKIQSQELTLEKKLEEIDALIEKEADLNGNAGQHGLDPVHAAINSKDLELVKELLKRGLSLQSNGSNSNKISQSESAALVEQGFSVNTGASCPAYSASQIAVSPGGPEMLEFLLENGLDFSCIKDSPIIACLRPGIATPEYNAERAIKVAEILVAHGVDVYANGNYGKNIFEYLEEPEIALQPHALTLKKALVRIALHNLPL